MMKAFATTKTLPLICLCLFFFTGCKRKGCTSAHATNYSAKAKKDCGCCEYQSTVTFWIDKQQSEDLLEYYDVHTLTFLVDGEVAGNLSSTTYVASKPDCGQANTLTYVKNMRKNQNGSYLVSVKDDTGDVLWIDKINVGANSCTVINPDL